MSKVGQKEKTTQARVVKLFQTRLSYEYLGDWTDRAGNCNIEESPLRSFLEGRGHNPDLITKAIHKLEKAVGAENKSIYDRNRDVYDLLRYGAKVKAGPSEPTETLWFIDWENPEKNHFAIAEEVTVEAKDAKTHPKRPDIVIYVNGIALGIIEFKRSSVSVNKGIRQNVDNQQKKFIQHFFSTMQLVMAGNDTEGLRYGTIETPEKFYLTWKEKSEVKNHLDRHLLQLCEKRRFLEIIHDFIVFDAGIKKLCRHNQFFGVKAAQERIRKREGGIIWHTQGSGKSLTMVWLAKWIYENVTDARVLIITDRTELDEQIEKVFLGVKEQIHRTTSGADLIKKLNATSPWLLCSLVHKFGKKGNSDKDGDVKGYIEQIKNALPQDFAPKGDLFVFVDECHRTQSGDLHQAMNIILPNAMFIGFTGTPLLKTDKKKSLEVFGSYIHTYKFDEAVRDQVVLDLRYEARDVDQKLSSQAAIDTWFEANAKHLSTLGRAQLKMHWGTMRKLLSSQSRLEKIVANIMLDMVTKDRLMSGHGNAILVAGSIYQACKYYDLFSKTTLAGKCAVVTSYEPSVSDLKGEHSGEGMTESIKQYEIYQKMLADWFNEKPEEAVKKAEQFEKEVKKKFLEEPGQMKLLIVVDKLLTGFDAPSATYLYIDKQMRDHGLFQAICRVNRLDKPDKEYGYIVDYKDLFKSLEGAVDDYTASAFDAYDKEDVAGLLENRLKTGAERLEASREAVKALCESVKPPKELEDYLDFFCGEDGLTEDQIKEKEANRLSLYKHVSAFVRAFADLANEMDGAGYSTSEVMTIKEEIHHYEEVRSAVKLRSSDYVDLKMFEPAMRHLLDTYVDASHAELISTFDDFSLVDLIVERGVRAVDALPKGIRKRQTAAAETIESNVRKLIVDESPINPKYYEKMSELLHALVEQRRNSVISYKEYLEKVVDLTKKAKNPSSGATYPATVDSSAKQALYDNLGRKESLALDLHSAICESRQDDWRSNKFKIKKVKLAIKEVLGTDDEDDLEKVLELVKAQHEY